MLRKWARRDIKILIASFLLFWLGQGIAHIPLIISRNSDSGCISNLAACTLRRDITLVDIGEVVVYIALLLFFIGTLVLLVLAIIWAYKKLIHHKRKHTKAS